MSSPLPQPLTEQHQILFNSPIAILSSHVDHSLRPALVHTQPTSPRTFSDKPEMHQLDYANDHHANIRIKTDPLPSSSSSWSSSLSHKRSRTFLLPLKTVKKQRSEISLSEKNHNQHTQIRRLSFAGLSNEYDHDFKFSPPKSRRTSPQFNKKYAVDSDSEIDTITPPLSPSYLFDSAPPIPASTLTTHGTNTQGPISKSPKGAKRTSSSRRSGAGKRAPGRQPSLSRDKRKTAPAGGHERYDHEKDSDRKDTGGEKDKDRGVKLRQRTAIACNYCRRRKIRCSGSTEDSENNDGTIKDTRCNNCIRFNQECIFAPVSASLTTIPIVSQDQMYTNPPQGYQYFQQPPPPPGPSHVMPYAIPAGDMNPGIPPHHQQYMYRQDMTNVYPHLAQHQPQRPYNTLSGTMSSPSLLSSSTYASQMPQQYYQPGTTHQLEPQQMPGQAPIPLVSSSQRWYQNPVQPQQPIPQPPQQQPPQLPILQPQVGYSQYQQHQQHQQQLPPLHHYRKAHGSDDLGVGRGDSSQYHSSRHSISGRQHPQQQRPQEAPVVPADYNQQLLHQPGAAGGGNRGRRGDEEEEEEKQRRRRKSGKLAISDLLD